MCGVFGYYILFCIITAVIWASRDAIRDGMIRWKLRRYRSNAHGPGKCRHCGYDIRANAERCSECGQLLGTPKPPPRKLL